MAASKMARIETRDDPPHRDRLPPHNINAEQAVLGGLLIDSRRWPSIADHLVAADFYRRDHQLIFEAIADLAIRGEAFDAVLVSELLQRKGLSDETGGLVYLASLVRDTPSAANARAYAEAVLERSTLRRLRDAGERIIAATSATDGRAAVELITEATAELSAIEANSCSPGIHRGPPTRAPLDWQSLSMTTPRSRDWIIEHWIPGNEVTLLAGSGGIGKTGVAQALGSCVAIHREYLDYVPSARKVLMWAGEDDPDELHRRQSAIAAQLGVSLDAFAGKLFLESYHRTQIDLAVLVRGQLIPTAMLTELRQQIADYGAELVILDNIARLFGGNENDRHQVSAFVTMLNHAAAPTKAGIILLGHPAKAAGSEFSGSTAWEGAVRTRLYLGAKLPDDTSEDEATGDGSIRFLCRRKANYSTKDWRRIKYVSGVMVPDVVNDRPAGTEGGDFAKDVVLSVVRRLAAMKEFATASSASPNYLPKLAKRYDLLDRLTHKQFTAAMVELRKEGRLTVGTVGQYANRNPRQGLMEAK